MAEETLRKNCLKCGKTMVKKTHSKTGTSFWSCTGWPTCRRSGLPFLAYTEREKLIAGLREGDRLIVIKI